ncbi:MAG TPA: hypothetical protein VK762_33590 [Polyangiaceae bacterium]|nr:hypothetical protein [Polyangiaceae bacterium]
MRIFLASSIAMAACACLCASPARAAESGEALDELRQGYSLKQAGHCQDALPHLARSFQLQPSARAALNLSDCEQRLGDLVAAEAHAAQGADLARQQKNDELAGVADEQLAAIEQRLPRLTVKLVDGAPDCAISRDSVALPAPAIGTAVAVNAGAHVLAVDCPGHASRSFDVSIAEGDRTETDVSPGPLLAPAPTPPVQGIPIEVSPSPAPRESSNARVAPIVVMGIGATGLAVGLVSALVANAKHAPLLANCNSDGACPMSERDDISAFHTFRTVSTVAYALGGAALIGGAVWWLVAPSAHPNPAAARLWIGPGAAGVGGRF